MSTVEGRSVLSAAFGLEYLIAGIKNWVCAIDIGGGGRGTGLLIGPDLVLTSYHVVDKLPEPGNNPPAARCRFDFREAQDRSTNPGRWVGLAAAWRVSASATAEADKRGLSDGFDGEHLDYAIIRLAEPVGEQPLDPADGRLRGWLTLKPRTDLPEKGSDLFVYQHPLQAPDNVSGQAVMPLKESRGKVMEYLGGGLRMRHAATTYYGSSGAPVFDAGFQLVAVHNSGDKVAPGSNFGSWNQAVPIPAIVRHLQDRGLDALLDQPPPRDTGRQATESVTVNFLNAASTLMDREDAESALRLARQAKGIVHVLTCRYVDNHAWFVNRLQRLNFGLKMTREERVDFLRGKLAGEMPWTDETLPWPVKLSEAQALEDIKQRLDAICKDRKPRIVTATVDIALVNKEREASLLLQVARHCSECFDADRLQLLVIYHDQDGQFTQRRDDLAKLWGGDAAAPAAAPAGMMARLAGLFGRAAAPAAAQGPPSGCGACQSLGDVGGPDLSPWSSDLRVAWTLPQDTLDKAVGELFASGLPRRPLRDIDTTIRPRLIEFIAASKRS